jgi:DNA-binding NarL/FixJ family response regulator
VLAEGAGMARKAVSLSYIDEAKCDALNKPHTNSGDYVGPAADATPFERLLWKEVRLIEKRAHMTDWQAIVWEWHLRGFSNIQIAEFFNKSESTVRQHLDSAFKKAEEVSNLGMMTVIVETLGFDAMRELAAERLDKRTKKHQNAAESKKYFSMTSHVPRQDGSCLYCGRFCTYFEPLEGS